MDVLQKPIAKVFTADELFCLPADARYELIRGELIEMPPPPGAGHGSVTQRLSAYVTSYVIERDLGDIFAAETGFRLSRNPDTVLAADFAFVAKDRISGPMPAGYLELAPDIVAETRSPSESRRDTATKVELWLRAGVRVVWVVDPQAMTLTVHRTGEDWRILGVDDTLTEEAILPGFSLPVRRIFRDAPPVTNEGAGR